MIDKCVIIGGATPEHGPSFDDAVHYPYTTRARFVGCALVWQPVQQDEAGFALGDRTAMARQFYLTPIIPGKVYVVLSRKSGLYKIGFTSQTLKKRVQKIVRDDELAGPQLVDILTIPTKYPYHLEQALHRRFADRRVVREWFALEDGDLDYLFRAYPPKD